MNVTCRINTTNWMAAQKIIMAHGRSLPSEALPRAVAFVVKDAKDNTPVTSISRIDTELSVTTTPVLSTRGARAGLPLKSGKNTVTANDEEDSLGIKIQLARLNRYSDYNILTDMRYALDRATFSPGMGRAGFFAKLKLKLQLMAKSRHSSTGFFQVTWNPMLGMLAMLVPANYRGAVMTWAGGGSRKSMPVGLAAVEMSGRGTNFTSLKIENRVGMDEKYPTISAIRNMRAHQILTPVLQTAINSNFDKQMEIISTKGWLAKAPELKALGVNVR